MVIYNYFNWKELLCVNWQHNSLIGTLGYVYICQWQMCTKFDSHMLYFSVKQWCPLLVSKVILLHTHLDAVVRDAQRGWWHLKFFRPVWIFWRYNCVDIHLTGFADYVPSKWLCRDVDTRRGRIAGLAMNADVYQHCILLNAWQYDLFTINLLN